MISTTHQCRSKFCYWHLLLTIGINGMSSESCFFTTDSQNQNSARDTCKDNHSPRTFERGWGAGASRSSLQEVNLATESSVHIEAEVRGCQGVQTLVGPSYSLWEETGHLDISPS